MKKSLKNIILGTCLALSPFLPASRAYAAQEFIRGDVDGDGKITLTDPIQTLNYLFKGGQKPDCEDAMDVNDDGKVDLRDEVYDLGYLFKGGSAPVSPFPEQGYDLTKDDLGCRGEGDLETRVITPKDIPLTITESGTPEKPILYILQEPLTTQSGFVIKIQEGIKNIILDGNRNTIEFLDSGEQYGIVAENAQNIEIRNFNIFSFKEKIDPGIPHRFVGILLDDIVNGLVHDNNIENVNRGHPILVRGGGSTVISNNKLVSSGDQSHVLRIERSQRNLVEKNDLISYGDNSWGFSLLSSDDNILRDNDILTDAISAHGGQLEFSNNNLIEQNRLEMKKTLSIGISTFPNAHYNTLKNNKIVTRESDSEGIILSSSDHNKVVGNDITTYEVYSRGVMYNSGSFNEVNENEIETFGRAAPGLYLLLRSDFNIAKNNKLITHGDDSDGIWVDVFDKGGNSFSNTETVTYGKNSHALHIVGKSKSSRVTDYKLTFRDIVAQARHPESQDLFFEGDFPENFYASLTNVDLLGGKLDIKRTNDLPFLVERFWYMGASVVNNENTPVEGAYVQAMDLEGNPVFSSYTGLEGKISSQVILGSVHKSNEVEYPSYNFIASHSDYNIPAILHLDKVEDNIEWKAVLGN